MRRFVVLVLLATAVAVSAETIVVDRVDVIEVDRLERRELEIDAVESALVAGRDLPSSIATVRADSSGWLLDDVMTGNYARATVEVDETGVWLLQGMAYTAVYVNGELRIGNVYGWKDTWESWEPNFDFSRVPVELRAGRNELLFHGIRWGRMRASLHRATSSLVLAPRDLTRPDLVVGEAVDTMAAMPVLNATADFVDDAWIEVTAPDGDVARVDLPSIPAHGIRKVGFPIRNAPVAAKGHVSFDVVVGRGDRSLDACRIELEVKHADENRRITFVSAIDGSVQYYGFLPSSGQKGPKALVLSLHGAAVEAINQSGSYAPLDAADIVAPTNRRPFGFDWENWGRLDALEVLDLAKERLGPDSDRIYLTGHSMGGHGTWHIGSLHSDLFAAIGPSAGWISYWSYRREPAADPPSPLKDMLTRATSTSRTLEKAPNLASLGVYVLHGDADDNVPPEQSRSIIERLEDFHRDFVYHEEPGAGHWWDDEDTLGAECVTWPPMFDFFARHRLPASDEVWRVDFRTPNPATSARNHWATVLQQEHVFEMSAIDLRRDRWEARISGTTSNVASLALEVGPTDAKVVTLVIDGQERVVDVPESGRIVLRKRDGAWLRVESFDRTQKGAHRNGGFRDAFTNRPQLVVGTQGSAKDTAQAWAKARFDAEYLWYQGNASLDVIADTAFDPNAAPDRNVVLYGNADTHEDWDAVVDEEVDVSGGRVRVGERAFENAALLAIRPRKGSDVASVGIVAGTSAAAMRWTERRPILGGGFAYPDVTVLRDVGGEVVIGAGFFGNDWRVATGDFVWTESR